MTSLKYTKPCGCETQCPADQGCNAQRSDVPHTSKIAIGATGLTLLACAACCVLPLAWPAIAVIMSAGVISKLEAAQPWMTALSLICVALAWFFVIDQQRKTGKKHKALTWILLGIATVAAFVAICRSEIEPGLLRVLGA